MKKVCILTTVHSVFDTRIFHKEAKTLVNAGYAVSLVAQHDKSETADGIKIIALPEPKNRFERIFFLTRKAYKIALKQKADIYHFHDPELLPWAIKLKKETRAKIIYDVHEDIPKQISSKFWIPKILRKPIISIFNFYEKRKAKVFNYIIVAAPDIEKNFKKYGVNNIITITNYPIVDYFKQIANNKQQITNNRKIKLIYVGGLTRIRGIKEIIESIGFIKERQIKLILIGKFDEDDFENEVKNVQKWKNVDFKGWLPQKEAYQEMQNSDIGIICLLPEPNYIKAIPNKMFEYMAAGIPVIASNFPLWKKIIEGNKCGICVNPLNPKEIAKAVEYLIEHPEEARKMGKNGRKAVLEKYNWENESKKLLDIYRQLTTGN